MGVKKLAVASRQFERALAFAEKTFVVLGISVMLLINVGQVLGRHLGVEDLGRWTDLTLALLPWVGMIGASLAVHENRHVGFTALRGRSPRRVRIGMTLAANTAMLLFFVILVTSGFQAAHEQYVIGGASPQLEIPRWLTTAAVPVGGVLMAIHAMRGLVVHISRPDRADPALEASVQP